MKWLLVLLFLTAWTLRAPSAQARSQEPNFMRFRERVEAALSAVPWEAHASELAMTVADIADQENVSLSGDPEAVIDRLKNGGALNSTEASQALTLIHGLKAHQVSLDSSLLDATMFAMGGQQFASSIVVIPMIGLTSVVVALAVWKDLIDELPFSIYWPCWVTVEVTSDIEGSRKFVLGATNSDSGLARVFSDMKTQCELQAEKCGYLHPRVASYVNLPNGERKKFACVGERRVE